MFHIYVIQRKQVDKLDSGLKAMITQEDKNMQVIILAFMVQYRLSFQACNKYESFGIQKVYNM